MKDEVRMTDKTEKPDDAASGSVGPPAGPTTETTGPSPAGPPPAAPEIGGRGGADPTRYGDWEINGRCVDF